MEQQSSLRAADRAAREAAKHVLRRYGMVTSRLRGGPDFIVIGAKRGGTTSMYNYLLEHPAVQPLFPGRQHIKGAHYYDSQFARGPGWYRSHFPLAVGDRHLVRPGTALAVTGEASPYYLFHPLAAERLAQDFPDVRIIVNLRDPVERAYSHFKERGKHGGEWLEFEEALAAEDDRLRGEHERIVGEPGYRSAEHENHSYLAQGRYLGMLERWFSFFPREQFHISASEEFYADPNRVVNSVWAFLGLPPHSLQSRKRHNYIPAQDIAPGTRERLQREFAEHNRELERLLGRPLPWPAVPPDAPAPAEPAGVNEASP
jgi:hypothetical protein